MPGDEFTGIVRRQCDLSRVYRRAGIERVEGGLRALDLGLADLVRAVEDLALEIVEADRVGVGDRQMPDARGSEIEGGRRAQSAGPGDEDARPRQRLLARPAYFLQHDVPREAFNIDLAHRRQG